MHTGDCTGLREIKRGRERWDYAGDCTGFREYNVVGLEIAFYFSRLFFARVFQVDICRLNTCKLTTTTTTTTKTKTTTTTTTTTTTSNYINPDKIILDYFWMNLTFWWIWLIYQSYWSIRHINCHQFQPYSMTYRNFVHMWYSFHAFGPFRKITRHRSATPKYSQPQSSWKTRSWIIGSLRKCSLPDWSVAASSRVSDARQQVPVKKNHW